MDTSLLVTPLGQHQQDHLLIQVHLSIIGLPDDNCCCLVDVHIPMSQIYACGKHDACNFLLNGNSP